MATLADIQCVKERYESRLLGIDGVVAVGIGTGSAGHPCIKVYISDDCADVSQQVPHRLDGIRVVVEAVGSIRAFEVSA